MKRKTVIMILCLLLAVVLAVPATAAAEYGNYYDETEQLWTEQLQITAEETIPAMIERYGIDIRVDVLTKLGSNGIASTAEQVYDTYGYGVGEDSAGVSLTVYVAEDENDWYPVEWYVYAVGADDTIMQLPNCALVAIEPYFEDTYWLGDVTVDSEAMSSVLCAFLDAVEDTFASYVPIDFVQEGNVIDAAGILSAEQEQSLEQLAINTSARYACGVYVVSVSDYTLYGADIVDAVINLYHDNTLGEGAGRDGILLVMDPVHREFAFFVYGENAEYIFDAYGQEQLEKVFLDDFGEDEWYNGFSDFVLECGAYMEQASQGDPVRRNTTGYYVLVVVISLGVALLVTRMLLGQMKSVAQGNEASQYVAEGGLTMLSRDDMFLYKTQTVRDLSDDDNGSSSSSFSGGGGSGRSGSF